MSGAIHTSEYLKKFITTPISIIGSHVQALPLETLKTEKSIDFVFTNEGVYSLRNLLKLNDFSPMSLSRIKGIAFRNENQLIINEPEKIIQYKQKSRDWVKQYHDLNSVANTLYDYYKTVGI